MLSLQSFEEPPRYVGGAVGKEGLREYIDQGYISFERGGEVVSRTLDYGFADYAVSQAMLKLLKDLEEHGKGDLAFADEGGVLEDAKKLFQRSVRAYSSLWNADKQLMVPKARGSFIGQFSSIEWGNGFTEGNSWHHSFPPYAFECSDAMTNYGEYLTKHGLTDSFNCHNGLIGMFPQQEEGAFKRLKALLDSTSDFTFGSYGQEIHEMTEGRALAMGQYFHNNQPAHHLLYLFSVLGKKHYRETQKFVRIVLDRAYGPDFYSGDEDNGEQGAWFVLSALGLYSATPGNAAYIAGSPIFRHVRITRDVGEPLDLFAFLPDKQSDAVHTVTENESKDYFVQKVQFISHDHNQKVIIDNHKVDNKYLKDGGILRFVLESELVNADGVKSREEHMMEMHQLGSEELELHSLSSVKKVATTATANQGQEVKGEEVKYLKQELQELTSQLTHLQRKNQQHLGPTSSSGFVVLQYLPWCCAFLLVVAVVVVYRNLVANDNGTGFADEDSYKRSNFFGISRLFSSVGRLFRNAQSANVKSPSTSSEYNPTPEVAQQQRNSAALGGTVVNRRQSYMV